MEKPIKKPIKKRNTYLTHNANKTIDIGFGILKLQKNKKKLEGIVIGPRKGLRISGKTHCNS